MITTILGFLFTVGISGAIGYYLTEYFSFNQYNSDDKLINSLVTALIGSAIFMFLFLFFGGLH